MCLLTWLGCSSRLWCRGAGYHYKCLDPYMRTPPFDKRCAVPECNRLIFHPLWTSNKALLEKRWAYEQAKEREISEVAEFFGVEIAPQEGSPGSSSAATPKKRDKRDKRGSKEADPDGNGLDALSIF